MDKLHVAMRDTFVKPIFRGRTRDRASVLTRALSWTLGAMCVYRVCVCICAPYKCRSAAPTHPSVCPSGQNAVASVQTCLLSSLRSLDSVMTCEFFIALAWRQKSLMRVRIQTDSTAVKVCRVSFGGGLI